MAHTLGLTVVTKPDVLSFLSVRSQNLVLFLMPTLLCKQSYMLLPGHTCKPGTELPVRTLIVGMHSGWHTLKTGRFPYLKKLKSNKKKNYVLVFLDVIQALRALAIIKIQEHSSAQSAEAQGNRLADTAANSAASWGNSSAAYKDLTHSCLTSGCPSESEASKSPCCHSGG